MDGMILGGPTGSTPCPIWRGPRPPGALPPGVLQAGGLVRPCPFSLFSTWLHTFSITAASRASRASRARERFPGPRARNAARLRPPDVSGRALEAPDAPADARPDCAVRVRLQTGAGIGPGPRALRLRRPRWPRTRLMNPAKAMLEAFLEQNEQLYLDETARLMAAVTGRGQQLSKTAVSHGVLLITRVRGTAGDRWARMCWRAPAALSAGEDCSAYCMNSQLHVLCVRACT